MCAPRAPRTAHSPEDLAMRSALFPLLRRMMLASVGISPNASGHADEVANAQAAAHFIHWGRGARARERRLACECSRRVTFA